jgi:Bacterial Ig-like domain (group 2)
MRISYLAAAGLLAMATAAMAQTPASIDAPRRLLLTVGHDTTLAVSVKDTGGAAIPGATVRLASADTSIVKVTMTGSLQAAGEGTTTVTALAVGADGVPARSVTASIDVTVANGMDPPVSVARPHPVRVKPRK